MVRRIEAQNNILHFKLRNKGVEFPKFEVNHSKTKMYHLLSEREIKSAMDQAKSSAIVDASSFGMTLDETILMSYKMCSAETCVEDNNEEQQEKEEQDFDDLSFRACSPTTSVMGKHT